MVALPRAVGEPVRAAGTLAVLESMKMEPAVVAPQHGAAAHRRGAPGGGRPPARRGPADHPRGPRGPVRRRRVRRVGRARGGRSAGPAQPAGAAGAHPRGPPDHGAGPRRRRRVTFSGRWHASGSAVWPAGAAPPGFLLVAGPDASECLGAGPELLSDFGVHVCPDADADLEGDHEAVPDGSARSRTVVVPAVHVQREVSVVGVDGGPLSLEQLGLVRPCLGRISPIVGVPGPVQPGGAC